MQVNSVVKQQIPEPAPTRLNSLQKLGRFLSFRGKGGPKGKSIESPAVGETKKGFLSPPNTPVFGRFESPKNSHETVRPDQTKDTGRRRLHHSISTPAIRPFTKQSDEQRRTSGEDDCRQKASSPTVVSFVKDIQPTRTFRRTSKPLQNASSASLTAMGSDEEARDLKSSPVFQKRKRSTDKMRSLSPPLPPLSRQHLNLTPEPGTSGSIITKPRLATVPRHVVSRQDSFESSSASPGSATYYPNYVTQEAHLKTMTSFDSGATSATSLEDGDIPSITEERPSGLGRKKSISTKACRVLGSCPHGVECAPPPNQTKTEVGEFGELPPPSSPSQSHKALANFSRPESPANTSINIKASRRMSLTLSTLTSRLRAVPMHVRRPSNSTLDTFPSPISPTQPLTSPGGLPDNISEASHELRDNAYTTESTHSLVSPISFVPNPPSPICPLPSSRLATSSDAPDPSSPTSSRKNLSFAWPLPITYSSPFDAAPAPDDSKPDQTNSPPLPPHQRAHTTSFLKSRPRSLSTASPALLQSPWSSSRFFGSASQADGANGEFAANRSGSTSPQPPGLSSSSTQTQNQNQHRRHNNDPPPHHHQPPFADLPVRAGWLDHTGVMSPFAHVPHANAGAADLQLEIRDRERERPKAQQHGRAQEATTVTVTKMSHGDWSGRWNEDDMQEVIHRLRKLR